MTEGPDVGTDRYSGGNLSGEKEIQATALELLLLPTKSRSY